MNRAKIPVAEYEQLAKQFDPVKFDADALGASGPRRRDEVHRHHVQAPRRLRDVRLILAAAVVSFGARDQKSLLQGLLFGGVPEMPVVQTPADEKPLALMRQMAALHAGVGLLEMTKHEFLDKNFRKERTTFADGTTVTVDWDANTFAVSPELTTPK